MDIPTGWNHLETQWGESKSTAFFHTSEFTIQVTHSSRDSTVFQVREGWAEGYDFENRETIVDFGWHNSPAQAFRFAAAYIADGGEDFRRDRVMSISPRYRRAVTAAYSTV